MNTFPYPIYDAHHHLWDLSKVDYPWLQEKGIVRFFGDPAAIQQDYLVADFVNDIGTLPVKKSVHIQVGAADGQHFKEAQTIAAMADQYGLADAIVAFCPLQDAQRVRYLDQLQSLNRVRGVRQIVGRSPAEDAQTGSAALLDNPQWLAGLQELIERNLCFDLQLIPEQMQTAAKIFRQLPELRVALCHCGSPWYRAQTNPSGWKLWLAGIEELASLPNVYCKISGLSMFDHNWTLDTLRDIINHVLNCFGAERTMCGSNFPVDKLHTRYAALWNAYLELIDDHPANFSKTQKQALFSTNCADFYRI